MRNFAASVLSTGLMMLIGGITSSAHAQPTPPATSSSPSEPNAAKEPSRAQTLMGDIAPKLAELTDDVLFDDVWARPGLSQRDRSLITVSALIVMNRPDQLRSHLARARTNGVTRAEVSEMITQLAFYAGWPAAISAVPIVREVYQNTQ